MQNKHFELITDLTSDDIPIRCNIICHYDQNFTSNDLHYEYELGIVFKGSMSRIMDGIACTYNEGEIWLNNILEPHNVKLTQVPCEIAVFVIRPDFLFQVLSLFKTSDTIIDVFNLPASMRPKLIPIQTFRNITSGLYEACNAPEPVKQQWLSGILMQLISAICVNNLPVKTASSTQHLDFYQRLKPAIEMALTNSKNIPVEDAAKACNMSRSLFEKMFSNALNMSYGQFLIRHRISGVARDLIMNHLTLYDIADKWGFADTSHLSRNFSKFYGMPPASYRKQFI